jgi:cell division protein FtsB
MSLDVAQLVKRHQGLLLMFAAVGTMGWAVYSGISGVHELMEKREQIRQLEEKNANLRQANEERRQWIERMKTDPAEQDLEIRKLNKLKPGERMFMLPEGKQDEKAPAEQPR